MKKLLAVLLGGAIVAGSVAFAACGDSDNTDYDKSAHMPVIPSGVKLSAVADEDMYNKFDSIMNTASNDGNNVTFDYYFKSEISEVTTFDEGGKVTREEITERLLNAQILKTATKTCLDATYGYDFTQLSSSEQNDDSSQPIHTDYKFKVRDCVFTAINDDLGLVAYMTDDTYKDKPFSTITGNVSLIELYCHINDVVRYGDTEGTYIPLIWDVLSHEYSQGLDVRAVADKSDFNLNIDLKADNSRLYVKVEYSFNHTSAGMRSTVEVSEKQTICAYIDTAAKLIESNFDDGELDENSVKDVLYYPTDIEALKSDFLENKQITLTPAGGGDKQNLIMLRCSLNIIHESGFAVRFYPIDAVFSDGNIIIAADSYSKLINEFNSQYGSFEEENISNLMITLSASYFNGYYCDSTISAYLY